MRGPDTETWPGAVLAVDVDGVLLDPTRGGRGPWQEELRARHGIDPTVLSAAFFARYWSDVIIGRTPIELALAASLDELHAKVHVEDVLNCWFEADFHVNFEVVAQLQRWIDGGVLVVLATNQEHRRAAYLADRFGELFTLHSMVYSAEVGFVKDDPRFYEAALERLRTANEPKPVVLLDDDPRNLDRAQSAGWLSVRFDRDRPWNLEVEEALRTAWSS